MSIEPDRRSAVIYSHVLEAGMPMLRIKRDELDPEDPSDSGWQFLCDSGLREDTNTIRIISVQEGVAIEPSISALLDVEVGSCFSRNQKGGQWIACRPPC